MHALSLRLRRSAALALLTVTPFAMAASGWKSEGRPRVTVHKHVFDHVIVESTGCELRFNLYFDAPTEGYADKRNAVRNHYRFLAEIKFADGQTIHTDHFNNRAPGRRVYRYRHDTGDGGCWARNKNKIVKLNVSACRGRRCRPNPLE